MPDKYYTSYLFLLVPVSGRYLAKRICYTLIISGSTWYHQGKRKAKKIPAEQLHLHRRIKQIFNNSRCSIGSRQLVKELAREDTKVCRLQVRN